MNEFRGHICWDSNVSRTIRSDVGAIPLEEDAVFLATHLGLSVETKNHSGMTEAGLLKNLRTAIDENLDAFSNDVVGFVAVDVDDEADTAGVALVHRAIETLSGG